MIKNYHRVTVRAERNDLDRTYILYFRVLCPNCMWRWQTVYTVSEYQLVSWKLDGTRVLMSLFKTLTHEMNIRCPHGRTPDRDKQIETALLTCLEKLMIGSFSSRMVGGLSVPKEQEVGSDAPPLSQMPGSRQER